MNTARDPKEMIDDLLKRSICMVQVAAIVRDTHGNFGWGWNSVGRGFGEHAEVAAIRRSNRDRLKGCSLYVKGRRRRNGKVVLSMPCNACKAAIVSAGIKDVWYCTGEGEWLKISL